ncbi:MAG: ComEC/Rec2 family competence protein [Dehalococcoidia bacterium]
MEIPAVAAAWVAAIALIGAAGAPWWGGAAVTAMLLPGAALWGGRRWAVVVLVAAAAALVSGARFDGWLERPPPPLLALVGQELVLEGTVVSEPDPGLTVARYTVAVTAVVTADGASARTSGKVLVSLHQYDGYLPGDRVRLTGELQPPAVLEGFDYRHYLLKQGVVGAMFRPRVESLGASGSIQRDVTRLRLRLDRALQRSLPEPEASLAGGIAFGRDEGLARETADDFRDAGLAHLLAVSGSNVVLLAAFVLAGALRVVPRRWALLVAGSAAAGYLVLAGLEASVLRAGVMAAVVLTGDFLQRPQAGLAALGVAVVALTAPNPGVATDIGFQLSAAAAGGLIAFAPWVSAGLQSGLQRARLGGLIPQLLVDQAAISLAASIATTPIVWAAFGRVTPLAPLANIAGAPLFNLAFCLSLFCASAGVVSEQAGQAAGLVAYYPLTALRDIARFAASVPGVTVEAGRIDAQLAALAGGGLASGGALAYRRLAPVIPPAPAPRVLRGAQLSALAILVAPLVVTRSLLPMGGPGELVVTVLDVGQGDAILLQTPHGRTYLVDGGPSGARVVQQLGAVLPHWQRRIDRVLLTHPQEDHVAGLAEVLRRFDATMTAASGADNATRSNGAFLVETKEIVRLAAGLTWVDDGVSFAVLWPPEGYAAEELNDHSLIILVTYGRTTFLLTGDAEREPLEAAIARAGPVTVLKVPHHGSKTTPAGFFGQAAPQLALISAGAGNRFGHPAPETLEALAATTTLRTDLQGRLTVRSDGEHVRYDTQR